MRFRVAGLAVILAALPIVASAQYGQYGEPRSASVVRQAGLWRDNMHVPDGHCGCPMPVMCDNYSHCCNTCGIRPVCWLRRVGRILGALLPCNQCCGGGCYGGHGCGGGCFDGTCGLSPGCSSCGSPALSDPFRDDPAPPIPAPTPEPATDVRNHPAWDTPRSIARDPRPNSQARLTLPSASRKSTPTAVAREAVLSKASEKSVLRRTSLEAEAAEPAEFDVGIAEATPIEAAPLVRGDDYWAGVPNNPLRQRK